MRNEDRTVIRLTHSSSQSNVIFYHFLIEHCSNTYQLACRYSKLRTIARLLPKTAAKFPQPCHLTMAVFGLLGNKEPLNQRYEKLTKYFDEISKLPQLAETKGFKRLLEESQLVEDSPVTNEEYMPKTPQICGRKICRKEYSDQLLIVIG